MDPIDKLEKLKATHALPSPSGVALKILRMCRDVETPLSAIASVVESDPATASRLLKYVNSASAGVRRRVASVSQAVTLLGLQNVKNIAVAFSLVSEMKEGPCTRFDYDMFWSESLARASVARCIAGKLRSFPRDEAFTCGLLCQIGRLAFATVYPETYAHALETVDPADSGGLRAIEREMFDIDHDELTALMMSDWHIPPMFCDAVRFQSTPEAINAKSPAAQLARILHLGSSIVPLLIRRAVAGASLTAATIQAAKLGVGHAVFADVFDLISTEWHEMGPIFDVATRKVLPLAELYSRATR